MVRRAAGPVSRGSAGHHHTAVHPGVEVAGVAVVAGPLEPVAEGAPGLGLGGEPLDVVGDRAVDEPPGDLRARRDLDRREELEVLGVDRRTLRTGGVSAGEAADPAWQAANVNVSTSRSGAIRRGGGGRARGLLGEDRSVVGAERGHDREHADQDQDGGQDELDDGDDAGRPGLFVPSWPLDASMRFWALLARTRATMAPTGGQMKNPTMAMTSAAVAELSVCGPAGRRTRGRGAPLGLRIS